MPHYTLKNQRLFLWLNRFVLPLFYIRHWGRETTVVRAGGDNAFKVRVNTTDRLLVWEIWKLGMYANKRAPIRPGDTVVDIGAHIGVFAVWAARQARNGRVIAYEPSRGNFTLLVENAGLNRAENLVPVNRAVFDPPGQYAFYQPGGHGSMGSVMQEASARKEMVDAVTLDDIFTNHGIDRIDFLKLDAEGAEYPVLFNASPDALKRIRQLVLEYHVFEGSPWKPEELIAHLRRHGFRVATEGSVLGQRMLTGTGVAWAWQEEGR
jgi:FkbM family methyltransferase